MDIEETRVIATYTDAIIRILNNYQTFGVTKDKNTNSKLCELALAAETQVIS